jgi:hypothetical protein
VKAWYVKTTLQRTVQALKRHRDIYFADKPEDRPASIIITTLAARAYPGAGSLYEVLLHVTRTMPSLVEQCDGVWWVENPVQPDENFAHRWRRKPGSDKTLLRVDRPGAGGLRGYRSRARPRPRRDEPREELRPGTGAPRRGQVRVELADARDRGSLGMAAKRGTLGVAVTRAVPKHTFHGDAPERL